MIVQIMKRNHASWNFRSKVDDSIKLREKRIGREMSKDETLDFLFGTIMDPARTELDLYLLQNPDKTVMNRINHLWVYPLTFVLAPFRYVMYGDIGWNNKTRLGHFIIKSCGYDKD